LLLEKWQVDAYLIINGGVDFVLSPRGNSDLEAVDFILFNGFCCLF
jgi:hypothetical protein